MLNYNYKIEFVRYFLYEIWFIFLCFLIQSDPKTLRPPLFVSSHNANHKLFIYI